MNTRLVDEAQAEPRNAIARYDSVRPGLGDEFFDAIDALITRIGTEAQVFPKWRDNRPYQKAVMTSRFPFVLYFRVVGDEARILAVAHGKRKPGYWIRRDRV